MGRASIGPGVTGTGGRTGTTDSVTLGVTDAAVGDWAAGAEPMTDGAVVGMLEALDTHCGREDICSHASVGTNVVAPRINARRLKARRRMNGLPSRGPD